MKNSVIVSERQTNQDPTGSYDVIYVDVMRGSMRVRRFVKPISKPEISLRSVIEKAKAYAKVSTYAGPKTEYIVG